MSMLFSYYQDTNCAIVYLSDQGEEVYDYRDQWGRLQNAGDARQTSFYHQEPMFV